MGQGVIKLEHEESAHIAEIRILFCESSIQSNNDPHLQ